MRSEAWRCILVGALLLAGCRPYVMDNSAVEQFPKTEQELDFLSSVEKMPAVTNNDAFHAFLLLQDGKDTNDRFEGRRAEGVRRGWIRKGEAANPNEAAKVGWMAVAGCRVMSVQGGLTMRLFDPLVGPLPRYATRELVYMEILPLRTENQILTGSEFVDYLNRLDRIAGKNRRVSRESPLGVPAGESAVSPGNEGAIQEGPLPQQGPREAPAAPAGSTPEQPATPARTPSSVPGGMNPYQPAPGGGS